MRSARLVLVAALIVGAVLFVVGTRSEHDHHAETPASSSATPAAEGSPEGEAAEHGSPSSATGAEVSESTGENDEKVLGIDLESGGIVAAVVVVSIALAGLVLSRPARVVLLAAAGFCALAAVADFIEMTHQIDRSETGLTIVAAAVGIIHLVGVIAGVVAARATTNANPEPAVP